MAKTGLLLTNLGTPDSTSVGDVRRYLREFLNDPRVVDLPPLGRFLLLNLIILPFRPKRSAHAYQAVWTDRGSPLMFHSKDLVAAVQQKLGPDVPVELGMRYGNPSLASAITRLQERGADRVVLFPLYPQFATSTVGSTVAEAFRALTAQWVMPSLQVVPPFFDHPLFLDAAAQVARPVLEPFRADHVLMSFHGVPERHVRKGDPSGAHCLSGDSCCDTLGPNNLHCYRAHSVHTAKGLARALHLPPDGYTVSFQSRLGRDPWIGPATEDTLRALAGRGVKRLAVMCPSFTADCLETLEEMGLRGAEVFKEAGGEAYQLVPCVNANPAWVDAVVQLSRPWLDATPKSPRLALAPPPSLPAVGSMR